MPNINSTLKEQKNSMLTFAWQRSLRSLALGALGVVANASNAIAAQSQSVTNTSAIPDPTHTNDGATEGETALIALGAVFACAAISYTVYNFSKKWFNDFDPPQSAIAVLNNVAPESGAPIASSALESTVQVSVPPQSVGQTASHTNNARTIRTY